MANVIAVVGLKGGTGKSTTTIGLAEAAAAAGHAALVVDLDPQGSALGWAEEAAEAGTPLASTVIALPVKELRRIDSLGCDVAVLDTPPAGPRIIDAAIAAADQVVVPVAPTVLDVSRLWPVLDVADELGVPATVVLTRVRKGTRSVAEAIEAITEGGGRIAATQMPLREAWAQAHGGPLPAEMIAAHQALLTELLKGTP